MVGPTQDQLLANTRGLGQLQTPLMGQLATEIPFYHLKNLPNKEATELTWEMVTGTLWGVNPKASHSEP